MSIKSVGILGIASEIGIFGGGWVKEDILINGLQYRFGATIIEAKQALNEALTSGSLKVVNGYYRIVGKNEKGNQRQKAANT